MTEQRIIITGGPGAGKTTLLEGLEQAGYAGSGEVSRRLIIEEMEKESNCLPWNDLPCFAGRVLMEMIKTYDTAGKGILTFFDRGIPDIIAYLEAAALPVTEEYRATLRSYRYAKKVFLLPPWEDIYIQDSERWQTFAEAVSLHRWIKKIYEDAGYQIIEVPKVPVKERVLFIQKNCIS